MKLTSKGRYAVTAALDIALCCPKQAVSLADISERQNISLSYLEQLFAKMRKHGIVKSVRGPGGGYKLNLPLEEISIGMIINAVNENIQATQCKGQGNCRGGKPCITHALWVDLSNQIETFLNGISLADLVTRHKAAQSDLL